MSWKVRHDKKNDVIVIFPKKDIRQHTLDYSFLIGRNVEPVFECDCNPRIEKNNNTYIIIHEAFDGRQALELAQEILNNGKDIR